jgi:hypothetical protein
MNRRELCRMLGAAVAGPALSQLSARQLVAAGRRMHRRTGERGFRVLDPHQAETVGVITELIIPETDTPGARRAGVPEFIDLLLAEWFPDEERARFLTGLAEVDRRSHGAFGADFVAGTEPQRLALLSALDAELRAQPAGPTAEAPFFQRLKALTVYGYYTSEAGAGQELRFEAVPGSYDPCTDWRAARAAPGDF